MPSTKIPGEHVVDAPDIALRFTALGLGPLHSCARHLPPGRPFYHQVELSPAAPADIAATLLRWLDILEEGPDLIHGRFTAADTTIRLNLRGRIGQFLIIVVAPVHDPAAVQLIDAHPRRQPPDRLLTQLAALPAAS